MKNKIIESRIVSAHNLFPDVDNPALYRPMGAPRRVSSTGNARFLTALQDGAVLTSSPGKLTIIHPQNEISRELIPEGEPLCAATVSGGDLLVMTDSGPQVYEHLDDDDYMTASGGSPLFNPVSITAEPMAPLTMNVEAITLGRPYTAGENVDHSDTLRINAACTGAYRRLCAEAAAQGVFLRPLIVRAVIRDNDGNLLHRGPELLVTPEAKSLSVADRFDIPMVSDTATEAFAVTVPTFRLRIRVRPMAGQIWVERAARLVIEVSPCFHPDVAASAGGGDITVRRDATSGQRIGVTMPGSERCLATYEPERNRRLIGLFLAAFDSTSVAVAEIPDPYLRGVDTVVGSYGLPDVERQNKTVTALLSGNVKCIHDVGRHLNAPHTFTARHVVATPAAVMYGDITSLMYPGYSVMDFVAETADNDAENWRALTTTTFADGRVATRLDTGKGNKPLSLNALLSYPDSTATMIDIVVEDDTEGSEPYRWRASLSPAASGAMGCAIGIAADLASRQPTPDSSARLVSPSTKRPEGRRVADAVATASPDNPTRIVGLTRLGSYLTALIVAKSTSGAWDFGRTRFYAFTSDRLLLLNTSAALERISVSKLADISIGGRRCVTVTDTATSYFTSLTGHIYSLDGTRMNLSGRISSTDTALAFDSSVRMLVSCPSADEPNGTSRHINPADGLVTATSTLPGTVTDCIAAGGCVLVSTPTGIYDLSVAPRLRARENVAVEMECTAPEKTFVGGGFLRGVRWNIDSPDFDGSLVLECNALGARRAEIVRYTVAGRIAHSFMMPVAGRPFSGATAKLAATVAPDTYILNPEFLF